MGDINFNIAKDVNLNKTVNLNIDKNVDVNVNIDDLLATAEADAEAFGTFALAEVDAYTYVNEGGTTSGFVPTEPITSQIDVLGNVPPFELGSDDIGFDEDGNEIPGPDGVNDTIGIDFTGPGTGEVPPDVDDVNASGALAPLDGEPAPPADTPIPDPLLSITDLNLTQSGAAISIPGGLEAPFTSDETFLVDFGTRDVDRNGNGVIETDLGETGELTLTVPAGTIYLAEFLEPGGGIEVEFGSLDAGDAFFTFTPEAGPDGGTDVVFNTEGRFVFESETIGVFADYAFEAIADIGGWIEDTIPGAGEAFAYAESTSAVDLNNDDILVATDVI